MRPLAILVVTLAAGCATAPAPRRHNVVAVVQQPVAVFVAEPLHTVQLVRAVASAPTTSFHGQPRRDLTMQTQSWESVPSVMAEYTTGVFSLDRPARVTLAGDANGATGIEIDNFLLLEVLDPEGRVIDAAIVGETDPVTMRGRTLPMLAPRSFSFGARQVDLGQLVPRGRPFALRATALDYGYAGHTSDVFLVVDGN